MVQTDAPDMQIIGADNSYLFRLRVLPSKKPFVSCRHQENWLEWWTWKKAKAKECQLEAIKKNEIMLLELIRGIHDHKLRDEFLQQKEPTLTHIVQVASRWQMVSRVAKT